MSTKTLTPPCSITVSSGSAWLTRPIMYLNPAQPPVSTLIRRPLAGSEAEEIALRTAFRALSVRWIMAHLEFEEGCSTIAIPVPCLKSFLYMSFRRQKCLVCDQCQVCYRGGEGAASYRSYTPGLRWMPRSIAQRSNASSRLQADC